MIAAMSTTGCYNQTSFAEAVTEDGCEQTEFKYEELDETAQQRARDCMRSCISSDFDPDCTLTEIKQMLTCFGVYVSSTLYRMAKDGVPQYRDRINWSTYPAEFSMDGEWSAADMDMTWINENVGGDTEPAILNGFYGRLVAVMLACPLAKYGINDNLNGDIKFHDGHENDVDNDPNEHTEDDYTTWNEVLHGIFSDMFKHFANAIENEYDYQVSDENLVEAIEANEYVFDEDGVIT